MTASKRFRPFDPNQQVLLPSDLDEWLPDTHLARFIADAVSELDLRAILADYDKQLRGRPPYDPRLMTRLLVYGYCIGKRSSRQIETATYTDVAFRWLSTDQHPDHVSISNFRARHVEAFSDLFRQVLGWCQRAGMVKLGQVSLDGTKIKANASLKAGVTYKGMAKKDEKLTAEIDRILAEAEAADAEEDCLYGAGKRGDELPEGLRSAQDRRATLRRLKAECEAEARAKAQAEADEKKARQAAKPPGTPGKPLKIPDPEQAVPEPTVLRNLSDPDARMMVQGNNFAFCYNSQIAVDGNSQVIVAADVSQAAIDRQLLLPMLGQVMANCGRAPQQVMADTGYFSRRAIHSPSLAGIDLYIPPERIGGKVNVKHESAVAMRAKLATDAGKAIYAKRKAQVEPVFGILKEVRNVRQFLMRSLRKVAGEWQLVAMTHNLLKLRLVSIQT